MPITINGTGTITGISAGGLPDNCITADDLATTLDLSSNTLTLPSGTGGKILQVVQSVKNDTFTTTSTSAVTTGLTASITPTTSGNKVLVIISGLFHNDNSNWTAFMYLYKDSSVIAGATGDTAGNRIRASMCSRYSSTASSNMSSFSYLDTTSGTSQITYQLYMSSEGNTAVMGRTGSDGDNTGLARVPTTLTLLEVAA